MPPKTQRNLLRPISWTQKPRSFVDARLHPTGFLFRREVPPMKLDQSSATNESPRWRKLSRKPALLVAAALFATSALGLTLGNSVPFAAPETPATQNTQQTIETPYGRTPLTFADIVQKVTPAVVSINVKGDVKVADNEQIPGLPDLPEDNPLYDFFKQFRKGMPQQQPKSQP